MNISKKAGFTLAEVLITLLIIGVVASLVIPALIQDSKKTEDVVKLKKEYASFQQAFKLLQVENGGSIVPVFQNDAAYDGNIVNAFATKLNVIKNCGNATGCWYDTPLYYMDKSQLAANLDTTWSGTREKAILADGTMVKINLSSTNCTSTAITGPLSGQLCGILSVDVNGAKGPNTISRDYFDFYITQTGIYPYGYSGDSTTCVTGTTSTGCTAKVLSEGAINY